MFNRSTLHGEISVKQWCNIGNIGKMTRWKSKGLPGENPDPHLFKANDWNENNRSLEHKKICGFKYALVDDTNGLV